MPRRKPVPSLYDISHTATVNLVISSCLNIEHRFPCDRHLDFDKQDCAPAILILQNYLRECVPSTHWGTLFHAVMDAVEKHEQICLILDKRLIYSTFIHDNVHLNNLRINPKKKYDDNLSDEEENQLVAFWVKRAKMLTKLLSIGIHNIPADNIISAISKHCVNLEEMIVNGPKIFEETFNLMLKSFKKLRRLDCQVDDDIKVERLLEEFKNLEQFTCWNRLDEFVNILVTFSESGRKLKLRKLGAKNFNTEVVQSLVQVCPELETICLLDTPFKFPVIMQNMEEFHSHLNKFKSLEVFCYGMPSAFNGFRTGGIKLSNRINSMGGFVTELHIFLSDEHNPMVALQFISENCQHLTKLYIVTEWSETQVSSIRRWSRDVHLPKLEDFTVFNKFRNNFGWVTLVHHCIAHSKNLQVFRLVLFEETDMESVETALVQMFSANEQLRQLKRLSLAFHSGIVATETLVSHLLHTCNELESLTIHPVTKDYETDVMKQVKMNNWDISVDLSELE